MSRIILPENPDDVLALIAANIAKEETLGTSSNLTPQQLNELKDYHAAASAARTAQKNYYVMAEKQTQTYENILGTKTKVDQPGNAKFLYTSLRDILAAKNKTNLKILAEWGFTVVDEVSQKKIITP